MFVQKTVMPAWDWLKGKKTFFVAVVALVYGFVYQDFNAMLIGLTAFGLRHGLATEVAKLATKKRR